MVKYDSYKVSGVEWIGDIPKHWGSFKLKHLVKICNGRDFKEFELEEGGYPVLGTGGVFSRSSKFLYDKPSVLLGRKGTINKPQIIFEPFWTSDTLYYTEINEKVNPIFLFHLVYQIPFSLYEYGSTIPSMTKSVYDEMKFPIPPISEQNQIVQYLDTKTKQVDTLIQKTQEKINLLREKRTSLINHAVTKGLNPHVEIKDSGVYWIGEIPKHWEESHFKYFIKLRHGFQFRDGDFTDSGIKVVKITQLHRDGYLDISNCSTINNNRLDYFIDILIKEDDILMCLTGGTIGKIIKVGKVDEPLLQNYRVGHFSSIDKELMTNDYMFYLMSSQVIVGQILFDVRETGQPNIGLEDMNRMKICVPPIHEQIQIVRYLDEQNLLLDTLIQKEEKRIELLKEYRRSLISDVVTGKIKVTDHE